MGKRIFITWIFRKIVESKLCRMNKQNSEHFLKRHFVNTKCFGLLILFFIGELFAGNFLADTTRNIQISVWPAESEIYVHAVPNFETNGISSNDNAILSENQASEFCKNNLPVDFSQKGNYVSPALIPLSPNQQSICVTIFKKDFQDTTLNIIIPKITHSHLMVLLKEETNINRLETQERFLRERKYQSFGKKMMWGSSIPFALALTSFGMYCYEIHRATEIKRDLKKHVIYTEKTKRLENQFQDKRENAKTYKYVTFGSLVAGALLLSVGIYFQF